MSFQFLSFLLLLGKLFFLRELVLVIRFLVFLETLGQRIDFPDCHELPDVFISDLASPFLELFDKHLEHINKHFLDLSSHHFSAAVLLPNLFKLFVVFQKELQVLERHVDFQVGSVSFVLFKGSSTTRVGVFIDFFLNIFL